MTIETAQLLDDLNSVTTIPIIPYESSGAVDYTAHRKNVDYLMNNNYLSEGRPRVIALAGTSLIHHVEPDEQTRLMDVTGQQMRGAGVLMSGIVPNPIGTAAKLIEAQSDLQRPPDIFLLMPLGGVYSPEGLYDTYAEFITRMGREHGARFLYYLRKGSERDIVIRLICELDNLIGVKVGTEEADVQPMIEGVADQGMVIWGIGDRSTRAAELGAKGHTSGIAVVAARASDEINNAQRRKDYATAREIEASIDKLEELRFMNSRAYNYAAVVEAMHILGADDIEGGAGGPFNPRVPADVALKVKAAVEDLRAYH